MNVTSIDEPPKLKSGAGTPVMGMIPTVIPTLTKIWKSSISVMPPAIRRAVQVLRHGQDVQSAPYQ